MADKKEKKSKTKDKQRLKSNKESSTRLDLELWEESEDRFSIANLKTNASNKGRRNTITRRASGAGIGATAIEQLGANKSDAFGDDPNDEHARGNWEGEWDFLLSLLGYSVGLGNVWRFPYLCYNNGGGAFLIPFTVMLIIAGLPLMFMELSFGQYAALGPVAIYRRFCPLFRGLGTGMIIVSAIVMLYYNLIIAWTIFYMFASFTSELPWQNCEKEWSTEHCFSYEMADNCEAINGTFYLRTCYNSSYADEHNITEIALTALKRPPAEEYFTNYVLGISSGIEETGGIKLSLALCLLAAWVIVFLCLCKGVQSSGKVVYFTALFPYVVLVILFFRGVTLPGASTGILFYLTPDWKQLANAQVWGDAAVQIFFALSPAWGGLITLSSYNKFTNNCYKDSLIVAVSNIATSFFAGLVIFSIIGFLAHELHVEVKKVVDQGAGLAFIVYPEVVTRLPISPVWSILFFVMLLTLGLDSQFALMETVTTAILDKFPSLRQYKTWVVLAVAIFGYCGGLAFTTNSGMYWLQLMDKYAANWSVLLIAISECILISWVYGSQKFLNDIQAMIGKRSGCWNFFWSTMWQFITPAALLFILFFNWVEYKPASYGHYVYPLWADAVGWIIGLLPVCVIFLTAFQEIFRAPKHLSLCERIRILTSPTAEWGPAGRPCVNLNPERYQSNKYDSVSNTHSLITGIPLDPPSSYDENGYHDEVLQLCDRVSMTQAKDISGRSIQEQATSSSSSATTTTSVISNSKVYEYTPVVVVASSVSSSAKQPGPSILKSAKLGKTSSTFTSTAKQKIIPECSPSKQPLIGADLQSNDSVGSSLNETTILPAKKTTRASASKQVLPLNEESIMTTSTPATPVAGMQTALIVSGTLGSGRERVLTTFGEKTPSAAPKASTVASPRIAAVLPKPRAALPPMPAAQKQSNAADNTKQTGVPQSLPSTVVVTSVATTTKESSSTTASAANTAKKKNATKDSTTTKK